MKSLKHRKARVLALALPALVALVAVSGCGSADKSSAGGNGIDRAFTEEMIPHHRSAITMAEIAQQRTKRGEIKTLAQNIIDSQSKEVMTLTGAQAALAKDKVAKGDLGMAANQMGMDMNDAALKTAEPFDRAFIDMMVPHHQGAIRMARIELAKGSSPELKTLAQQIIDAQATEIGKMNRWRTTWYGAASPAGGVPTVGAPAGSSSGGMDMPGGHSG